MDGHAHEEGHDHDHDHDSMAQPTIAIEEPLIVQTVVAEANETGEPRADSESDKDGTPVDVRYVADLIMNVFAPVALCMVLVVIALASPSLPKPHEYSMIGLGVSQPATPTDLEKFYMSLTNVILILVLVITETFLLVLAIAKGYNRLIKGFLTFATAGALMTGTFTFTKLVATAMNRQIDLISFVTVAMNFVVIGVVSLQVTAPIFLQHATQVFMSASMAVTMIFILSPWTTWLLLVALIVYDICAVLLPWGPLNLLIKQITKKNQGRIIGGLAYAGGPARRNYAGRMNGNQDGTGTGIELQTVEAAREPEDERRIIRPPSNQNNAADSGPTGSNASLRISAEAERRLRNREKNGIQLGLGDFVFYSILVGETVVYSDSDWTTTASCIVIILAGMLGTMGFLLILERPLPALPISLTIGVSFYFIFFYVVKLFVLETQCNQVFI